MEEQQADQHAEAGQAEAILPAPGLPQIAADDGCGGRAHIYAHVEDRIGRVAARIGARIELPHDHRDIGLEETRADDDQRQRQPEHIDHRVGPPARSLERHHEMAESQQDGAEQHRLALPQIAVGQIAADDRHDIDQRRIGAIDHAGLAVGEHPVLDQVEDQQRPHPVIGEAFPHLRQEQHEQPLGMAAEFRCGPGDDHQAADQEDGEHHGRAPEQDECEGHAGAAFPVVLPMFKPAVLARHGGGGNGFV